MSRGIFRVRENEEVMSDVSIPPCNQQQRLIETVQAHLMRIAELSRATADALARRDEDLAGDLDKQVETEVGAKERALGALRQHRREHGC